MKQNKCYYTISFEFCVLLRYVITMFSFPFTANIINWAKVSERSEHEVVVRLTFVILYLFRVNNNTTEPNLRT